jgi:methyl-accepting chemotaxis protein
MKWFKNKSISAKLMLGFLVIAMISVIVGAVGIVSLASLGGSVDQLYNQNLKGVKYSGSTATNFQMVRYNILRLSTLTTKNDRDSSIQIIKDLKAEMETNLENLGNVLYSTEAKGYYSALQSDWELYQEVTNEFIQYVDSNETQKALGMINEKIAPLGSSIHDNLTKLTEVVSINADNRANNTILQGTITIWVMIGAIAAGLVISLLLATSIARMIGNPVKEMAAAADKLAVGDVEIELKAKTADEIGKLTDAFMKVVEGRKKQVHETQRMAEGDLTAEFEAKSEKDVLNQSLTQLTKNLNELVMSIQTSAEQVASGANLVSNTSMALSQGASEQASSVQQLTASLEEIASQTNENAKNAQSASEFSKNAKADAELGNAKMSDMITAMADINQSSGSISKIIKVIDDIAFQTNILALNAAVEAARAGQHGKGFAVVAEEVRTLAARSAQAAKETTDLIEGSIRKVEAGTKIANETAEALVKIVHEVAGAAELVESIATASLGQASAIEQINQGITQVSQVVQNNAATSEEGAAASEELSSQAEQLRELVSTFRIKNTGFNLKGSGKPTNALQTGYTKRTIQLNDVPASISLSEGSFGKY